MSDEHVLVLALGSCILIGAPGVTASLWAAVLGARASIASAVGLAISALSAIVAFWAYFVWHPLGLAVSFGVPALSVGALLWAVVDRREAVAAVWRMACAPWCLWTLGTIFVLALGFLHGGEAQPISAATTRFSHPLPIDNQLPQYFAEGLFRARSVHAAPPFGEWLSSDRPPLQVGYLVTARPFGWAATGLEYQVLAVALQQLWIVGAWVVLTIAPIRARTRALVMLSLLVGDIAIVHGFFVWPKLIAVGFLLAAVGIVFDPSWRDTSRRAVSGALLGTLLGAALLCHGASFYAVIPLVVIAVWRAMPSRQFIGAFVIVIALLQVLWMGYQQFADPPGDRLQKWMLAGYVPVTDESLPRVIVDAYLHEDLGTIAQYKLDNLTMVTGSAQDVLDMGHAARLVVSGDFEEGVTLARHRRFFHLGLNVGLLLVGLVVMAIARVCRLRRSTAEWVLARQCLGYVGAAILVWIVVQYGNEPSVAVIHTGSLLFPMLLALGCVLGAAAVSERLAAVLVAVNCAIVLVLYVPTFDPQPGTAFAPTLALVGAAAVGLFVLGALRFPTAVSSTTRGTPSMLAPVRRPSTTRGGRVESV